MFLQGHNVTLPKQREVVKPLPKSEREDYCTPFGGIMEIMPTEGHIMCPEGCIMLQRDALDQRSRHPEGV